MPVELTAKLGAPVRCHCGTCRSCKRRVKYAERKQLAAKKSESPPAAAAAASSEGVFASPADKQETNTSGAYPAGASVFVTTSPRVDMPEATELPPAAIDWTSLSVEDEADPDPEQAAAQAEADAQEEAQANPGFIHCACGTAAVAAFNFLVGIIESNGYVMKPVVFQGVTLTRELLMGSADEVLNKAATNVAVKWLPDVGKPALLDEVTVLAFLGGGAVAARYTSQNPRKLKAGEEEEGEEGATVVGTGADSQDFEPAAPGAPTAAVVRAWG